MDFRFSDEQALLRSSVREFAETEIRPHVMEWDEGQLFPHELVPKLAALGLMGIQVPESFGGAGMPATSYCICLEELARVCPGVALSVAAHNGLAVSHLSRFGNTGQKARFLEPLARGQKIGAWALTESSSGSDAAHMRTTATAVDGGWVLQGNKTFITHGGVGHVVVVMAVTDKLAGKNGISAFVLERGTPGLRTGRKENKLGMRASDTCEVIFDNCFVPAEQLLGPVGSGFSQAMDVLDAGRIGIAALAVGLAQGALDASIRYALDRQAFGHAIAHFEAIQWKLADAATHVEAARLLTYRAASQQESGQHTTLASAMAKLFASEMAVRVAEDGIQIHGGYGFVKDYPAEKYYRDVKLLTIGEGTSEIQRLIIARELIRTLNPAHHDAAPARPAVANERSS